MVAVLLWGCGAVGVEERDDRLIAAFDDAGRAATARAGLGGGPTRVVERTVGLDEWRDHAEAVVAGPFVVRPPWVAPRAGQEHLVDLVIDPGHSFGSGSHPSTRLALVLLAEAAIPGMTVLDVGCGSGVLSIAATRLGAVVRALDTDPDAVVTTRRNAAANGVADRITVLEGEAATAAGPAELVTANLTVDVHEHVASAVVELADPRVVLVSGILDHQAPRAVAAYGGREVDRRVDGEWVGLVLDL